MRTVDVGDVHQVRWLTDTPDDIIRIDPVRMAHGVLTGIGFLCGGVIFREGFNVRGLTTAASLWMTSSLGILLVSDSTLLPQAERSSLWRCLPL